MSDSSVNNPLAASGSGELVEEPIENKRQLTELEKRIAALKTRAEVAASAAEQARSKADSESGFAYNAKQNAEEHAKAISQIKGTVEADSTWLATTKTNAEEAAQAIARAKGSAESDALLVAQSKTLAEKNATLVAGTVDQAASLLTLVTKAETDSTAAMTRSVADVAAISESRATIDAGAVTVKALQVEVAESAAKVKTDATAVATAESDSQALLKSMTAEVGAANRARTSVEDYEKALADLTKRYEEVYAKTETLLPGATSAGLASAFRAQKTRFDRPARNWLWTFIAAVALLLISSLAGLPIFAVAADTNSRSWDEILRHLMSRLPLVGPLVWLGVYAGRNYMLALRMQEEYAFKEAISATFEGYKREMATIPATDTETLPLLTLCNNVLRTLVQRPGRI